MSNWLQKIIPPTTQRRNLPSQMRRPPGGPTPPGGLPNASIIYGMAAAGLFVIAFYYLFFGNEWIKGLLVLLPAGCFLGFALHFVKHPH
jgi:hypothetical protein